MSYIPFIRPKFTLFSHFCLKSSPVPYPHHPGGSAGGSGIAALRWKRPSDSRLIMACDTLGEAQEWKEAIEVRIHVLLCAIVC